MKVRILIAVLGIISFSCGSKKTLPQKKETVVEKPVPVKSDPFFKATGTEPLWSVEISKSEIIFTSVNESENFSVPYAAPILAADANVKLYRSKSDTAEIEITVSQGNCSDGMSDKTYSYTTKVGLKRVGVTEYQNLSGCGNYVVDKRLNTAWTLQQLNGKSITKEDFGQELPYIDFHTEIATFTGFGGCNRINGKVMISDLNLIRFVDVVSTRMMCLGSNKETDFMRALQSATHFELKDSKLILLNGGQTTLVFTK